MQQISRLMCTLTTCVFLSCCVLGCGGSNQPVTDTADRNEDPPLPVADEPVDVGLTPSDLRSRLKAANPGFVGANAKITMAGGEIRFVELMQTGVTDISPLAGLPLRSLDLGFLDVSNIDVLKGMPLESLILENTKVTDISVLKGMPLHSLKMQNVGVADISALDGMELYELNLMGTKVTDISVVRTMPLATLWIPGTQVKDLSPLKGKFLESLDIQDTPVSDLTVVGDMLTLKRLNIARSAVTDLTPLKNLNLDRLIFTPESIKTGIEVVRNMSSLNRIGTTLKTASAPADFWSQYDAVKP